MIGVITQLPCQQKAAFSALAGGVVAAYGYDTLLPLPRIVHWSAAGILVDYACRAPDYWSNLEHLSYSAAAGVGGASLAGLVMGKTVREILKFS